MTIASLGHSEFTFDFSVDSLHDCVEGLVVNRVKVDALFPVVDELEINVAKLVLGFQIDQGFEVYECEMDWEWF